MGESGGRPTGNDGQEASPAAPPLEINGVPPRASGAAAQPPEVTQIDSENGGPTSIDRQFTWAPVDGATGYRFELYRGDTRVFSGDTRVPRFVLLSSWRHDGRRERLTPATYWWYVWPILRRGSPGQAIVQARLDIR